MSERPAIPLDIQRLVFVESGHRCAVCCCTFPLEKAHIVPWNKTKDHSVENLICLCANCHDMADHNWDTKTLQLYKQNPCVKRYAVERHYAADELIGVQIIIKMDLKEFTDVQRNLLQYGLAGFLEISPREVKIEKVVRGSVIIYLTVPDFCEPLINSEIKNEFENLSAYIYPIKIYQLQIYTQVQQTFEQEYRRPEVDFFALEQERKERKKEKALSWLSDFVSSGISTRKVPFPSADISSRLPIVTQMCYAIGKIYLEHYSHEDARVMAVALLSRQRTPLLGYSIRDFFGWIPGIGSVALLGTADQALFKKIGGEIINSFASYKRNTLLTRDIDTQKLLDENENYSIYKFLAKDSTGRSAWYLVRINNDTETKFFSALEEKGEIDLATYGEVVASGYGETVPVEIENELRKKGSGEREL